MGREGGRREARSAIFDDVRGIFRLASPVRLLPMFPSALFLPPAPSLTRMEFREKLGFNPKTYTSAACAPGNLSASVIAERNIAMRVDEG